MTVSQKKYASAPRGAMSRGCRPATAPENGNRAIAVRFAVANRF
jgi:hypothetical protein